MRIRVGDDRLEGLRLAAKQAEDHYKKEIGEHVRTLVPSIFDGAVFKATIQANSEMRIPRVSVTIVQEPFAGTEVVLDAFDLLRQKNETIASAFRGQRDDLNLIGAIGWDTQYPPQHVVDEIERMAMVAVFRDVELRLKKMPSVKWLDDVKKVIDKAIVEGVQKA